jgi:hypothetical protein
MMSYGHTCVWVRDRQTSDPGGYRIELIDRDFATPQDTDD